MKKILLVLPLTAFLSCNNSGNGSHADHDHEGHNHEAHEAVSTATEAKVSHKTHDPVCGMPQEASWTLLSTYNGDTVRFCSEVCKEQFDKKPEKYTVQ